MGKFLGTKKCIPTLNKRMSTKSKIKILESCTLPVMHYGAQTCSLTKTQTSKSQTTQGAMERKIMGIRISDKISNSKLRSRTQSTDVGNEIQVRRVHT